jgi:hypothetical protein
MNEWIQNLDSEELKQIAPPLFFIDDDPEEAAVFLYREGKPSPVNAFIGRDENELKELQKKAIESRPPKKYWDQVKKEFHLFICTDDQKYEELRKKLKESKEKGTTFITGLISGAIAVSIGVEAGALSAFCAVLLNVLIKIGIEAYCGTRKNT